MIKKYPSNIREFITSPTGTEKVEFMGTTLYTSKELKENVKKASKKYMSKRASSIVTSMVDNDRIFPVFNNKNILDYIRKKGRVKDAEATAYKGNIYIFLDSFYSLLKLSSVNEKKLASVIVHELIHVAEYIDAKSFFDLNKRYFIIFFKEFFGEYLSVDKKNIADKIITDLLERIIKTYQQKIINFRNLYMPLFKSIEQFTSFDEKTYKQEIWPEFLGFLDEQYSPPFAEIIPGDIFDAGKESYIKLTGRPTDTLGQEFWSLSEIIAMIAILKPTHSSIDRSIYLLTKKISLSTSH